MEDVEVVDGAPRKAGLNLKPMFQTKSTSKYQLKGNNNNKSKDNKSKEDRFIEKIVKMKMKQPNGDIIETPTTCYGNLEFKGATRRSRAKFIRISDDTPPSVVYKLMVEYWKMEQPRLLLSVTGGAKNFRIDPILKQNFAVGLLKVASSPGCWVISGGTNAGVMKHVGDALQGSTKSCIGIATWGVISKREKLSTAHTTSDHDGNIYSYEVGTWLTETGVFLDNNHTHFILVDNGTEGKFGVEIPWRGKFEKFIMANANKHENNITNVPSVLLVVEGGPGTIGTIHSAVAGDDPVPVVVVKSSGRAADVLVYALTLHKEILDCCDRGGAVHKGLMEYIRKCLPELKTDEKKNDIYDMVANCLKFEDMFTISQVGTDVDIDDAILAALLNDKNTKLYRQVQLTLMWNRADLARAKIFSQMLQWGAENEPHELQWITIMSLAMDNVEFVELLLEYGVSFTPIITHEVLEFLYGYRSYNMSSPMRYEFNDAQYKQIPGESENREVYKMLCTLGSSISTTRVLYPRELVEHLVEQLCDEFINIGDETFIEKVDSKKEKTFEYPFRELFFWAILNNMQEMARFLWKQDEEYMPKALIGAHMCEKLTLRINQSDVEKKLLETSGIFKDGALNLLDQCSKLNEQKTRTLITYDLNAYNNLTVLNLAVDGENIDFVSHYSVQGLLEDVWRGSLKVKNISLIKILLSYFFIFPIFYYFQFQTEEEIQTTVKTEDEYEEHEEEFEFDKDDDKENSFNRSLSVAEERKPGTQLSTSRKLVEFYSRVPVVKFVSHTAMYVVFLILFAYVAMMKKNTQVPSVAEFILIVTVFAYLVAELYQLFQADAPSYIAMISAWASSRLNLFDGLILTLYLVALGFRLNVSNPLHQEVGHLLYAFDCGLWIFRLLSVCVISPKLGPYLVMITRMTKDLMTFLSVLMVIIIGFGVASSAILHPGEHDAGQFISYAIWQSYFNIYGELFIDRDPESNTTTRFGSVARRSFNETCVWIFLGIYLLFTNILLLNLLIAVFNNTYNEVQAKASQIWAYKRYDLILEYADRIPLFPPFSLIGHLYLLGRWVYRKCAGKVKKDISGLRTPVSNAQRMDLLEFECMCMTKMCKSKATFLTKSVEETASEILDQMDDLKSEMLVMKEKLKTISENKSNDLPKETPKNNEVDATIDVSVNNVDVDTLDVPVGIKSDGNHKDVKRTSSSPMNVRREDETDSNDIIMRLSSISRSRPNSDIIN